jgi:hypothetical protein
MSGWRKTLMALALCLAPTAARAETPPTSTAASSPSIASGDGTSAADDSAQASPTPSFFDVNKYRADPGNPGAIRVPGTNIALYIGGFAQLDVMSDVNVIAAQDQFVVSSIPVAPSTGNTGFQLSARQSRVFLETDAPWSVAPLMAYVELDFFDPQNQNVFHIRHAFGAIGRPGGLRLIGGHTWSSFMDATIIPNQLDYAGPVGIANVQQGQLRLIVPLPIGLYGQLSIEAPAPQITLPMNTQGTGYSRWPDLIATLRWDHGHGHLHLTGVFRQIGNLNAMGDGTSKVGYGGNFTGRLAGFWGKDQFLWSVGAGRAVAHYFAGSNGLNQDAFLQADGQLSLPSLVAAMASYTHTLWGDRLGLTGIYSVLHFFNLQAGTDTTFRRSQYVGGVLQYFPNKRFMTGFEYLFGQRENRNGDTGSDNRLQVSTMVKF